ncbi:MAG: RNA polymerase sigma factor [Candidatus Riflebacteria bacterium]|nr:RNA polymerase sigma factor [Candidatus Riflebacteria bacterium]
MKSADNDALLLESAKRGERKSFEQLVDRYLSSVYGFFQYLRAPKDMIDDLVQETFTKAFLNIGVFDLEKTFISWLLRIARNVYFDQCRKVARINRIIATAPPEKEFDVEDHVVQACTIKELLNHLPADSKILVELRVFQDLPFSEIASLLDETEGSVRVRFHRIINRLKVAVRKGNEYGAK